MDAFHAGEIAPPTHANVLVIEDDRGVRESLAMVLQFHGLHVEQAPDGEQGLRSAEADKPDLVVLDLNLPGIDGLDVCRRLRQRGFDGSVLMLTARHDVADRVSGLDSGADDYLAKPFALEEFLARVRALLRRTGRASESEVLKLADLTLDVSGRHASRAGEALSLTKREFDLLQLMIANAGKVLTRDIIMATVWGYDAGLGSNSLEVFVSALRRKLEAAGRPRLIHTVRGVGYVARSDA